jgi:succinate-semialdehyde dehydrogenase/glutarate-semialdehyde dehydrogenase
VQALKVSHGLDEGAAQGPLIDEDALAKVEDLVADAVQHGARVLTGGKRHALGGTFYEPTILGDVTTAMRIASEEVFGPVAPLFKFNTEANDMARVWRVAEAIQAGMVGVNTGIISTAVAPFGGVKQSGMGREGSHQGIEEYMDTKYICLGGVGAH